MRLIYKGILFIMLTTLSTPLIAVEDHRPPFDKTPYLKTAWSAANPWWLPNKSRIHGQGGPDFAWHRFSDESVEMWKQVAQRFARYGFTGLQFEMTVKNTGYTEVYKSALEGFKQAGTGMQAGLFLTYHSMDIEVAKTKFLKLFDKIISEAKNHPNAYRLNGCPVAVLYGNRKCTPEGLSQIIKAVEDKHGRIIWLVDAAGAKPEWLRSLLPYIDGISMYANWSIKTQEKLYGWLADMMHNDFPQKIFEGGVHTSYTVHFHYGGVRPKLTEKFRKSWEITLNAKPDAVTITNWFDCYENSRIMPSYELDDSMLRISEYMLDKWRSDATPTTSKPDLYVSNYTNVMIGNPICVEVLAFPLKGKDKDVSLTVDLCDSSGKSVYCFPERKMILDSMKVEWFEVPSERFAAYRALHPKITYRWKGKTFTTTLLPQTNLVTSILPHMLFWTRSLNRIIKLSGGGTDWKLNDANSGQTTIWPRDSRGVITSHAFSNRYSRKQIDGGGGWVRILRNNREIDSFRKWDLKFTKLIRMPDPGQTLDWYNLELENSNGGRYLSPTIWVSSGKRNGMVSVPILTRNGSIKEVNVEAERVPFFYYPCSKNGGGILIDDSGYEHHGYLGGKGYGGGHLARTAYRHEHIGKTGPGTSKMAPLYKKDEKNRGYLNFNGKNYVMLQGGTAFPYASTYEMYIKPDEIGKPQRILGSANGQMAITLLADGRISAARSQPTEGEGGKKSLKYENVVITSKTAVPQGKWTHIAAVYDLKDLSLYINGNKEASAPAGYSRSHEWINAVVVGGGCKFPYIPIPEFKGGIRDIRIYGRNLNPEEFIRESHGPESK